MTIAALNRLSPSRASAELIRCCGSTRWAKAMAKARPFDTLETMQQRSDEIWASLGRRDWLEAFAAHPRIGGSAGSEWSAAEQSGAASAGEAATARLASLNDLYERRFGHIFVVCATGKSAAEMLDLLEARMSNGPHAELRNAAEEQRKITNLRLAKLVDADA
jgi:2-oxo-4-hydroxy-4-carboxy-5-ureidoimidazoline decarboxylase